MLVTGQNLQQHICHPVSERLPQAHEHETTNHGSSACVRISRIYAKPQSCSTKCVDAWLTRICSGRPRMTADNSCQNDESEQISTTRPPNNQARYNVLRIIGPNTRPKACAICCIDITSKHVALPQECFLNFQKLATLTPLAKPKKTSNSSWIACGSHLSVISPVELSCASSILVGSQHGSYGCLRKSTVSGVAQILRQVYPRLRCGLQILLVRHNTPILTHQQYLEKLGLILLCYHPHGGCYPMLSMPSYLATSCIKKIKQSFRIHCTFFGLSMGFLKGSNPW